VTSTGRPSTGRKYIPEPEGLNLAFHRASAGGTLHLQQCESCAQFRHPPRHYCPQCASPQWSWTPVSGRGRVYSWVVTHFTVDRGWVDDVPYTTVAVELDEGPRVLGALRDDPPRGELEIGLPVTVSGEPKGAEFVFLWVDPAP
jgi:uncharacterized OB-fold protein